MLEWQVMLYTTRTMYVTLLLELLIITELNWNQFTEYWLAEFESYESLTYVSNIDWI